MIDVVVAGGGPTGLAVAIEAARAGMEAVVVEPRSGPIDKACGEGLMPPAVRLLHEMGVDVGESHPFRGIRYLDGRCSAQADFPTGSGLGVRRTVLHAALLERARSLGVRHYPGRVREIRSGALAVESRIVGVGAGDRDAPETACLQARWLVAADGLHSKLRRTLGVALPPVRPARFGIRRHFRTAPWTDRVEVYWSPDAEAYVTPVSSHEVGVAFLFRAPHRAVAFDTLLAGFPALRERLGEPSSETAGAGPFEQRVRRRVCGRVLLAGDAAGFLDPLTGEGVRLGLAAARELVRCLRRHRPEEYERAWRRLAWRYWALTSVLLEAGRHSFLRPGIVPLLRRCPGLLAGGLRFLTG